LFAGPAYEEGMKRIADFFNKDVIKYRNIEFNPDIAAALNKNEKISKQNFPQTDLSVFTTDSEAYHYLMLDIIKQQVRSTQLVLNGSPVKRLFVDGGFSRNAVYMNLLAMAFPQLEVYAASMAQATALGAALAIHSSWNKKPLPNTLIRLQYYSAAQTAWV
jgi:hypothetical protein